jgi:hypothetical protein
VNKKQISRDNRARGRAVAKQSTATELLAPAQQQTYKMQEASEQLKLASMSTSPDLTGAIKMVKTIIQISQDENWKLRQRAELLKTLNGLSRSQIAILLMMGSLRPATSLEDSGAALIECARETIEHTGGNLAVLDTLRQQLQNAISRAHLIQVNAKDEIIELPDPQRYDVGEHQSTYDGASPSVDPIAEIQLTNYWIEQAFTVKDYPACLLLLKQLQAMAILHVQVAKQSGSLISREAASVLTKDAVHLATEALRMAVDDYDPAVDYFRERLMLRFQTQQQIEQHDLHND